MPNYSTQNLINALTQRIHSNLTAADSNGDGHVDSTERSALAADIRPMADSTADYYFSGGPMPIDAYAQAIEIAAQAPSPTSPAPPLGRFSRDDVLSELVQELTAAAGDMGITEQDPSALAELAETIVGLDLHASRRPRHTD